MTERTIHELTDAFRRGEATPTAVTEAYLARIEKLDGQIGAYLTVTREHARRAATAARRATTVASYGGTKLSRIFEPQVVLTPRVQRTSL